MKRKFSKIYGLLVVILAGYCLIKGLRAQDIYWLIATNGLILTAMFVELVIANDKGKR